MVEPLKPPVIEFSYAPPELVVRVFRELPRDPKRPYFVQTTYDDHVYVPADAEQRNQQQ